MLLPDSYIILIIFNIEQPAILFNPNNNDRLRTHYYQVLLTDDVLVFVSKDPWPVMLNSFLNDVRKE